MLQQIALPIQSDSRCSYTIFDSPTQICAGGVQGKDTCKGDSGGPLSLLSSDGRWTAIGVTSYGYLVPDCGYAASGFTRVSGFISWIQQTIASN